MSLLYHRIENYYEYIIKSTLPDNYFDTKDDSPENCTKLAELLTGLSAQCNKREYYLNIMNNFNEKTSNELMQILLELIPVDEEESNPNVTTSNKEEEDKTNENAMLWIRAENAERECDRLNEEISKLTNKNTELTQRNYTYELTLKENEAKYQELIQTLEKRDESRDDQHTQIESMKINIQLSELKGKLEAKEKSFKQYREEKERMIDEYKQKIFNLTKENGELKEKSVKFDVLKEQMKKFSMEEMYSVKQKLMQSERSNKEKDEVIKKLKSYDDKQLLLNKIKDLNTDLALLQEQINDMKKENESYRYKIVQKNNEIEELKAKIKDSNESHSLEEEKVEKEETPKTEPITLGKIEEDETEKMNLLELETKLKITQTEKENLAKEKNSLSQKIKEQTSLITEQTDKIDKLTKKSEKYSQLKKENQTFISKITDLMDKVEEIQNENASLKTQKAMVESSYNDQISDLNKKLNESEFKVKELDNQLTFVQKENQKYEELSKSNKLIIQQLQKKEASTTDSKLFEVEKKLKELTEKENNDLKTKLKEKEEIISKQNDKIKKVYEELKEVNTKMDKIPSEISKRDEAIDYYKSQLEQKEKIFNEETRILSSLYYNLASQCAILQEKNCNPNFALNFN